MELNTVKKNYILNVLYQLLLIGMPLITTPYLSRTLGVANIGEFSYAQSILRYFTLIATLGISTYGQREISKCNSKEKLSIVFTELLLIKIILFIITSILYFLLIINFSNQKIYWIQWIELISVLLDITWFFQGLEDFKQILLRGLILKLCSLCLIFVFIHGSDDLLLYVFLHSVTLVLCNSVLWSKIPGLINGISFPIKPQRHFNSIILLFIPQIAIQIYTVIDKTMLGILSSSFLENGYYEQAQKIVKLVVTIVTSVAVVILPKLTKCYEAQERDILKYYLNKTLQFNFFLSIPMALGLIAIADGFIPWFMGNEFIKVSSILKVIAPIIILISINTTFNTFLVAIDKKRLYTCSVICGAFFNVMLNIFLIPKWGAMGASTASVASELLVAIIDGFFIIHFIDLKILRKILIYMLAAIVMFIAVEILDIYLSANIINTIGEIVWGIIIYSIILYICKDSIIHGIYHDSKIYLKRRF